MILGRTVIVEIGQAGTNGRRLEGLRVGFDIRHSRSGTPSPAKITIYNPSRDTIAELQRPGAVVRLLAGYQTSGARLIFQGNPVKNGIAETKQGPDRVVAVEAADGGAAYALARVSVAFPGDVSIATAWGALARAVGLPDGSVDLPAGTLAAGLTLTGPARDVLARFGDLTGRDVFVRDGTLCAVPRGRSTGEPAPVISPARGTLIGSPTRTDAGVRVTALLDPGMRPGRRFVVESEFVNGTYTATDVQFTGDSGFDRPFYVVIDGVPEAGATPGLGGPTAQRTGAPATPAATAKPNLSDVLRAGHRDALANVHTAIPATITSYDHATQRASVRPTIASVHIDPATNRPVYEAAPEIHNVPIWFPSGSGGSITWPLTVGDDVLIVVSERSIAEWKKAAPKGLNIPIDPRRFDWSDAIALPGTRSLGAAAIDNAAAVFSAAAIKLGGSTATQAVALGPAVESFIQSLLTWASTHFHTDPVSGTTGPATVPPPTLAAGAFNSAKVKSL